MGGKKDTSATGSETGYAEGSPYEQGSQQYGQQGGYYFGSPTSASYR